MCSNAERNQIGKLLISKATMMMTMMTMITTTMIMMIMTTTITVGCVINIFKICDEIKENEMSGACSMRNDRYIGLHNFG
jgi:hypothetical protein